MSREQGSGQEVARRVSRRLIVTALVANLSGALLVYALVTALLRDHDDAVHLDAFTIVLLAYVALGLALGLVWGSRRRAVVWGWLREDRDPDPAERERALRDPMRGLALMAALWGAAAVLFGVLEAADSGSAHDAVVHVGLTIALGGLATCAVTYLLSEWALRPVIARVLASGAPGQPVGPSVGPRLLVGWALVTGVPVLGVAALAIGTLTEENHDIDSLAVSTLILAGSALIACWWRRSRSRGRSRSRSGRSARHSPASVTATSRRRSRSTTAARSARCRRASTRWPRVCASGNGFGRRSARTSTVMSPSTSCARERRSRAKKSR